MTPSKITVIAAIFAIATLVGVTSVQAAEAASEDVKSLRLQLKLGVPNPQCQNDSHLLVLRINGDMACVYENTANKLNWKIISQPRDIFIENETARITPTDLTDFDSKSMNDSIVLSGETMTLTKTNSGHGSAGGIAQFPISSFEIPTQVQKGVPFTINATWSWNEYETDDDTGEIEVSFSASESGYDQNMQDTIMYIDIASGVKLLDTDFVIWKNLEIPKVGYGNTLKMNHYTMLYDESQQHTKKIKFQIDSIPEIHNRIEIGIPATNILIELFVYEDTEGIITIAKDPKSDHFFMGGYDLQEKFKEDKAKALGTDRAGSTMAPTPMTPEQFDELERQQKELAAMHNNKTFADIPETAKYIKDNNITGVIMWLADELYTLDFIEEFLNQYPELGKQSVSNVSPFYSILPLAYGASNDITVYGKLILKNMDDRQIPAKGIKACVLDFKENKATYKMYDKKYNDQDICTTLSRTGFYSLTIPNTDPHNDGTTPDPRVYFYFEKDNKFRILDSNEGSSNDRPLLYEYDTYSSPNVSGSYANMGIHIPTGTVPVTNGQLLDRLSIAYNIFLNFEKGWNHFKDNHSYTTPSVDVEWGREGTPTETFFYEDRNTIALNNYIDTRGFYGTTYFANDGKLPHVMMHEYGHKVQHSVYGLTTSQDIPTGNTCESHTISGFTNNDCAWAEGWANFVSAMVTDNPVMNVSTLLKPINIETAKYDTNPQGSGGTAFPVDTTTSLGTANEGWVASALWDIFDNSRETGDNINSKKTELWNVFDDAKESDESLYPAHDLLEFYADWQDERNYPNITPILELNKILTPSTTTPPQPTGQTLRNFYDNFNDLSKWTLSGTRSSSLWSIATPSSDSTSSNKIAQSKNCDRLCVMTMIDKVDLSNYNSVRLTLDRYLDSKVDNNEGLKVYGSSDNGVTWTLIPNASWTGSNRDADNNWHSESITIPTAMKSADFKLKIESKSSKTNEIIEIDNVKIVGSRGGSGGGNNGGNPTPTDTTPPSITITSPTSGQTITINSVTVSGSASDSSGIQKVSIAAPIGNAVVINGATSFTHTFTGLTEGSKTFTITAWDDSSRHNRVSQSVTVTIDLPNPVAPVITPITDVTLSGTTQSTVTLVATDSNGDTITFSLVNAPSWVTISGNTITINPPSYLSNPSYTITVKATDSTNLSTTTTFTINVPQVKQPLGTLLTNFGSSGTDNSQFNYPYGIAVDTNNRKIIVDQNNNRVQIFDTDNNFVNTFGSAGSGNAQFNEPIKVTTNSTNHIFVTDVNNHRVQIFDSDGNHVKTFGSKGTGNGEFNKPYGITVDSNNRILVTDNFNHRVQVFDSDGVYQSTIGSKGTQDGQFYLPQGIATNSTNHIFVADSAMNRIQVFDVDGNYLDQFTESSIKFPRGIDIDSNGNILVADKYNLRVIIFNSNFEKIGQIGELGLDNWNGAFGGVTGIAFDNQDQILVSDNLRQTIYILAGISN